MKNIICVIPARSGSKRIKNKNTINFFGKPLIYYSIKVAKDAKIFDKIIVTTDSLRIKKIAEKYGAEVPFIRSKKLSNDLASTKNVLRDCIERINSKKVKFHCLLYPTAPLITKKDLQTAFKKLKKNNKANGIITIQSFLSSPLRSLVYKKNYLTSKWKKYQFKNSNNLQNFYFDTGNFYIYKTKQFLNSKDLHPKNMIGHEMSYFRSIDINDMRDLQIAKKLYVINKIKKN